MAIQTMPTNAKHFRKLNDKLIQAQQLSSNLYNLSRIKASTEDAIEANTPVAVICGTTTSGSRTYSDMSDKVTSMVTFNLTSRINDATLSATQQLIDQNQKELDEVMHQIDTLKASSEK